MTARTVYTTSWAKRLCYALDAPFNKQNDLYLRAWAQAEGCMATFNPFATTLPLPNATKFNLFTAGNGAEMSVYNYATWQDGVAATSKTLQNGKYPELLRQIRLGQSAKDTAIALKNSPWGTGALTLEVLTYDPRPRPMGNSYPSVPVKWYRTIKPGMVGEDVDELLRSINRRRGYDPINSTLGHKWYTDVSSTSEGGNPVQWVRNYQKARPWLWTPDGIVGPKSYASICGHP
jgi:hypothetical protein